MLKKGLGKGLDMLFESAPQEDEAAAESSVSPQDVSETQLTLIEPNRNQPRRSFDPEKIDELAQSIREHGLIQPIIITPAQNGRYTIVAGERRWRAAKKAGLKTVPTVIREYSPEETAQIALIENLQREDLNPIEEAKGYKVLTEEYGMTQAAVAESVGKSRPVITNAMRLLTLPEDVLKLTEEGKLSLSQARAILEIEDDELKSQIAVQAAENSLTVREISSLAGKIGRESNRKKSKRPVFPDGVDYYAEMEKSLSSALGRKVKIQWGRKKGKIEIEYYGDEDFEEICAALSSVNNK